MGDERVGWVQRWHALVPLLVAIPVVAGVAITLGHILTTRYPDLGWAQTVANDGRALTVGAPLYGPPSQQYTGMLYGPVMPAMLAPLYRLFWWDGWSLLISTLAGVGLGVLVAGVAASGRGLTWNRVVGGIGVGGIAFWIVTTNAWNFVFTGRVDQLAWLFALAGLCVLAVSVAHRWPRTWPAVLLLTAGLWTKQLTIGAVIAALVMVTWWAASGVVTRRTWLGFTVGLGLTNVVLLGTLLAVTRGWIWFSLFEVGARKHTDSAIAPYLSEVARLFAIPVLAVGTAAIVGWWRRPRSISPRSFPNMLFRLVAAFLVVEFVVAFLARRQQGAGVNEYLGMMWAFGLLLALIHRAARTSRRAMQAGIAVYSAIALLVFIPPLRSALSRPKVVAAAAVPRHEVATTDPAVVAYARDHLVYVADRGIVSPTLTDEVWPSTANLVDVLASGEPVDYFVTALIERRFDAVTPINGLVAGYVATSGRMNQEYVGALNALIAAGYVRGANGAPSPLLGRRPRPMDLSWARRCFTKAHPKACITQGRATQHAAPAK